jgi:alkyl hydroperoxide reductase subunit AhpC/predicted Ser/Thr protein kinase
MPRVGATAPDFALTCIRATDPGPRPVTLDQYRGRWLILLFYPRDFSFVCPTELTAFSARVDDFVRRNCDLLGISVDSIELHQEWVTTPPEKGGLGPLRFPLASDADGRAARSYGVWIDEKGVASRGLFIVDPDGVLQYAVVHNLNVGRSPDEVLRVLDALRTGGLCPASWTAADGTLDPERALQPGRILGHYRIRGTLGGGTFGTVFAARDLRLERMVALQVLKRKVFESREAILSEARTAAKLSHPHVCTVYAVDEIDSLPVIAMEYLDGRPLSDTIADGLDRPRAMRLAVQIAAGLATAHQNQVVHGDLKPANIIVRSDDLVKIVDFGLARPQQASASRADAGRKADESRPAVPAAGDLDADATIASEPTDAANASAETGMIQGTPGYMSPEHASGRALTAASDVFSFGLILFEMLTGRPAIADELPVRWILKLQTEDPAPEIASQVEEPFREWLAAMLARAPASRPAMNEVLRLLESRL